MFAALLRRLSADRSGNFGFLTALLLVPIVSMAGLSIDTLRALDARNELAALADAATLAALSPSSAAVGTLSSQGVGPALRRGEEEAKGIFMSQLDRRLLAFGATATAEMVFERGALRARLTYRATVPTTVLQILGLRAMPVSGVSLAEWRPEDYRDFHVLVDNSPSMGIGATSRDILRMVMRSKDDCSIACHAEKATHSTATLARDAGAQTRLDVVRTALGLIIDTMQTATRLPAQYRMAIYTFGEKAQKIRLTTVAALTDDRTKLQAGAASVQLMTTPEHGYQLGALSPIDRLIGALATELGAGATGLSDPSREKVVILVSDGLNDSIKPASCSKPLYERQRCMEPLDTAACTTLKQKGVKVAVLYTTQA